MMLRLLAFCIALWIGAANAGVTSNSFVTPQTPNLGVQTFIGGTDTVSTYKTIYTGGANGSKCFALMATTNDSISHLLTTEISRSAGAAVIITATTITSGGSGTSLLYGIPINIFAPANAPGLPVDNNGVSYVLLGNGDLLRMTFATTLSTAGGNAQINAFSFCGDF